MIFVDSNIPILHRYVAINRRDAIQPAFDAGFDGVPGVVRMAP